MHHPIASSLIILTLIPLASHASTTIDPTPANHHTHAANTGWANWNWDPAAPDGGRGATVTAYTLSGKIYHANIGWIDLGDGTPTDGIRYSNTGTDFGVNHDGTGHLTGLAYSANTGWVTFAGHWQNPPAIDLATGRLHGYAYSANTGWIDLGTNPLVAAVTTTLAVTDSDDDEIDDAWEREHASTLTSLSETTDADHDGATDAEEFTADTDPFDPASTLTPDLDLDLDALTLTFPTSPRRRYHLYITHDLETLTLLQTILPTTPTTTIPLTPTAPRTFYQLLPALPLSP